MHTAPVDPEKRCDIDLTGRMTFSFALSGPPVSKRKQESLPATAGLAAKIVEQPRTSLGVIGPNKENV
jgi:hypothetical protein